jgi:hypothetical protein
MVVEQQIFSVKFCNCPNGSLVLVSKSSIERLIKSIFGGDLIHYNCKNDNCYIESVENISLTKL